MHIPCHYTQIDIAAEVAAHTARIAAELEALRHNGAVQVDLSPHDLFLLEALGYLIDLSTGLVVRDLEPNLARLGV